MTGLPISRCARCHAVYFPPRLACARCGAAALETIHATRATVDELTDAGDSRHPLASVTLDAGPVAIVRLDRPIARGATVRVWIEDGASRGAPIDQQPGGATCPS